MTSIARVVGAILQADDLEKEKARESKDIASLPKETNIIDTRVEIIVLKRKETDREEVVVEVPQDAMQAEVIVGLKKVN